MCFGDSNVAERRHVVAGGERRGRHKEARAWWSDREVKASRREKKIDQLSSHFARPASWRMDCLLTLDGLWECRGVGCSRDGG